VKYISETNNLSARQPEKRQELQAAYDAWNATLPAPIARDKASAKK